MHKHTQSHSSSFELSQLSFMNEINSIHNGQIDGRISAVDTSGEVVGYIDYTEYNDRLYIDFITTLGQTRKGTASAMIDYMLFATEMTYDKVLWGYTTVEGTALRAATDKRFGIKSRSSASTEVEVLDRSIIDVVAAKDKTAGAFLKDLVDLGVDAWDKWNDNEWSFQYDYVNELADTAEWVEGTKFTERAPSWRQSIPDSIIDLLQRVFGIQDLPLKLIEETLAPMSAVLDTKDIEAVVLAHCEMIIAEAGFDVIITGIKLQGSRMTSDFAEDADLDVVVSYTTGDDTREDTLFNEFNLPPLLYRNIVIDINPVNISMVDYERRQAFLMQSYIDEGTTYAEQKHKLK